jgi:hypothetical protein
MENLQKNRTGYLHRESNLGGAKIVDQPANDNEELAMKNPRRAVLLALGTTIFVLVIYLLAVQTFRSLGPRYPESRTPHQSGQLDKALIGSWKVISIVAGGKQLVSDQHEEIFFNFTDGRLLVKTGIHEEIAEETYEVDPFKHPKSIDLSLKSRITL